MRLFLIRHAESTANAAGELSTSIPGPPLTDRGREQAAALVHGFTDVPLDAIAVSTMRRTRETALPLSVAQAVPVQEVEGLHEIEAGDLEGSTDADSLERYRAVIGAWARGAFEVPVPGAFDGRHFLARFDRAIGTIAATTAADASVAVCTHSVAMRVWVATRAINCSPAFTAVAPLDNGGVVELRSTPTGAFELVRWQGLRPTP